MGSGRLLALGGLIYWALGPSDDTYQVERTEYKPPAENAQESLVDDRLADKKPPAFNAALVDRRPLNGWLINASAAILQLDLIDMRLIALLRAAGKDGQKGQGHRREQNITHR